MFKQSQPSYFIKIIEKELISTIRYVHKLNLYLVPIKYHLRSQRLAVNSTHHYFLAMVNLLVKETNSPTPLYVDEYLSILKYLISVQRAKAKKILVLVVSNH